MESWNKLWILELKNSLRWFSVLIPVVKKLDKLTIKELGTTLSYVLDNHKDSGNLIECIIGSSDHREENDFDEFDIVSKTQIKL